MNTRFRWLLLILLFAAPAYAQNVRVDNVTFSSVQGFPFLAGATITICTANATGLPCSPTVSGTCLSISDTTCNQSAVLTSDPLGNYGFWIQPGSYSYTVTKAGFGGFGPKALTLSCQLASNCTNTGNVTIASPGSLTVSGTQTGCNYNGWSFNNTAIPCFSGSDFGAQFNTAYAAMPGTGTRIHAINNGTNGVQTTYSFSTPMVATNTSNSLMLSCPVEQSTILTFTPTTGVALTLAGGGGNHNEGGVQVENCTFYGSGSGNATTGIQFGSGANGLANTTFKSITVGKSAATAFGTGLNLTTSSYLDHFFNSHIIGNNIGAQICGEGINFYGGLFGSNATGIAFGGATNCAAQAHWHGVSFDDNTTNAISMTTTGGNTVIANCTACHFENFGLGTDAYVNLTSTSSTLTLVAGELNDDRTSGTSSGFVTASAGQLGVFGTTVGGAAGSTNTQAFNLSGNVNAVLFPLQLTSAATIPNIVTPAYLAPASSGGAVILCPMQVTASTLNCSFTGTGVEGSTIGPGLDLVGRETGGKGFRIRENGGLLEFGQVSAAAGTFVGLRGRLVGGNFNSEFTGIYSDQGGACTNTGAGGLTLSAGWGTTAAPSGVVGVGQTCEWTITSSGTGQAANPTVTWTLPNAMPTATIVCTADVHGGTQAFTTFDQTSLTSSAPVFTFNGTPVAGNTVKVVIRCGP